MNTATKLAAYVAALAVVFASAFAVGNVVGPVGPAADQSSVVRTDNGHSGMDMDGAG